MSRFVEIRPFWVQVAHKWVIVGPATDKHPWHKSWYCDRCSTQVNCLRVVESYDAQLAVVIHDDEDGEIADYRKDIHPDCQIQLCRRVLEV